MAGMSRHSALLLRDSGVLCLSIAGESTVYIILVCMYANMYAYMPTCYSAWDVINLHVYGFYSEQLSSETFVDES